MRRGGPAGGEKFGSSRLRLASVLVFRARLIWAGARSMPSPTSFGFCLWLSVHVALERRGLIIQDRGVQSSGPVF